MKKTTLCFQTLIFLWVSLFSTQNLLAQTYCSSKSIAPWELWVSNARFETIDNASDKFKDFATLGYSDYTSISTNLTKGQTYPLSITPSLSWSGNLPNVFARVWIDFNNNKTFETNELVLEKTNANPLTNNVLIPNTAITGAVRMRVSVKWGGYPTACETFNVGEVEDYTIQITEGGGATLLPDLTLFNLFFTDPAVQQGTLLSYTVGIRNQGTASASSNFKVRAYISTDSILDATDIAGGVINPSQFVPNFSETFSLDRVASSSAVPPNLPVGTYYLILKADADNDINESNENNNIIFKSFSVTARPDLPDLTLDNLSILTPSVNAGDSLRYKVNVKNIGTKATPANTRFFLRAFLSRDNALSTDDYAAPFSTNFNETPANFTYPESFDFIIPPTNFVGQYYLLLVIDETFAITESNEVNNIIASATPITVTAGGGTNNADLAISLNSTPSVITQPFSVSTLKITAQNVGNQAITNAKIRMPFGSRIVTGGTARPSTGTWQEWCAGGVQCFEWTIPNIAAGATATLDVPIYIGSLAAPAISITASLISSTPTDGNAANNVATLNFGAISPTPSLASRNQLPTSQTPVVIQSVNPSITAGDFILEIESLVEKKIRFDIYNTSGLLMKTENINVEKGLNKIPFDIYELPQGIYLIKTERAAGRRAPIKLVKL